MNLKRRHLSESQRAMVAAKLATFKHGGDRRSDQAANLQVDRASAAKLLHVSERSVASAHEVRNHGAPELVSAVEHDDIAVSTAADVAKLPIQEQQEIVARGEPEILRTSKDIRARKTELRRSVRIARLAKISEGNTDLPLGQRFPIILADPAWKFRVYDEASGMDRAAANHYPTMPLEEICKLPVAQLATADSVLFLWCPAPHLREAFTVLDAWGFKYVTNIAWVKETKKLGYWVRNQHEHLLIAKRGNMPTPPPERRPSSVINAATREHSRKPDKAYALIERMYPELPKIELFARGKARKGWAVWGNEAVSHKPVDDGGDEVKRVAADSEARTIRPRPRFTEDDDDVRSK
jgi:N6-adenosine-specific RNA methylase IME4